MVYQPFVPLSWGLAINTQAVIGSNAERNLLDLQSIINYTVFSNLTNGKEKYWKSLLQPKIEALGFKCYSLNLAGTGNVDLLIVSSENKTALAIELKFRSALDRIKQEHVEEIGKGVNQATHSVDWLRARTTALSDGTVIDGRWIVLGLVVVKHHAFLGYMGPIDSPVITERLFLYLLEDRKMGLAQIWQAASDRKYSAHKDEHFTGKKVHWKFGTIEVESTGFLPGKDWDIEEMGF